MSEKNIVIDGLELDYNGVFSADALLRTIDGLAAERGYEKSEKRRQEIVSAKGKEWSMELRPTKNKTAWEKLMIKIRISVAGLGDVEVLKDHMKERMQKGTIHIIFDAWIITDWEARWEQKPWLYVIRSLFEKAFFKFHTDRYYGELIDDTHHIYNNVKAHLNLHRF
jgi:hypothetical protein